MMRRITFPLCSQEQFTFLRAPHSRGIDSSISPSPAPAFAIISRIFATEYIASVAKKKSVNMNPPLFPPTNRTLLSAVASIIARWLLRVFTTRTPRGLAIMSISPEDVMGTAMASVPGWVRMNISATTVSRRSLSSASPRSLTTKSFSPPASIRHPKSYFSEVTMCDSCRSEESNSSLSRVSFFGSRWPFSATTWQSNEPSRMGKMVDAIPFE